MNTFIDQVFITPEHHSPFFTVVTFTNNISDENHYRIVEIERFMNEHFDGKKLHYTFDYNCKMAHYVLGTWKKINDNFGKMTDIETDSIMRTL